MKIKAIGPSSHPDDMLDTLTQAVQAYEKNGIQWIMREDVFCGGELPFFASSLETRQEDLIESIVSTDYEIIWALRGGYGAGNLIEKCLDIKPSSRKILIGFSDITALHVLFNQHYGLPTIHGDNVLSCFRHGLDFSMFEEILRGKSSTHEISSLNTSGAKSPEIHAPIFGGNLSVLTTLIGTALHPKPQGKILFLEDIHEKGYAIHRNLMHLKQSGLFQGVRAVLLGDFTEGDDLIWPAIEQFFKDLVPIPAFRIPGIGHGPINRPLVLGTDVILHRERVIVAGLS